MLAEHAEELVEALDAYLDARVMSDRAFGANGTAQERIEKRAVLVDAIRIIFSEESRRR